MAYYEYVLSFQLAEGCPASVVEFFDQVSAGNLPGTLPEVDERSLQTAPENVVALLAGAQLADRRIMVAGRADAADFYMPFIALVEWLARWSASRGPVGYYHQQSLANPTLLYFAQGKSYMLQATGTPVDMDSGQAMPDTEPHDDE